MVLRTLISALLSLVVFAFPLLLFAHGTGASYERTIGKYTLDIGYDPVMPRAGDRLLLDFALVQPPASTTVDFDYVWVRLQGENGTLVATGIHKPDFGPTSLVYLVPSDFSGDLTIQARYQKADDTLIEDSFTLPVQARPRTAASYIPWGVGIAIGVFATGLLALFMRRFRKVVE